MTEARAHYSGLILMSHNRTESMFCLTDYNKPHVVKYSATQ